VFIVRKVFNLFGLIIPISTLTSYANSPGSLLEMVGWHTGEFRSICYFSSEDDAIQTLKDVLNKKILVKERKKTLGIVKVIDHKDLSSEADEHQI
jgi:hypothetical protein